MQALGLIETAGYATAVSAADVALKAADVELIAVEKVIGVSGLLGVTIQFSGDVAAVSSAVEAGKKEAERVGKVISAHVIPRAHSEVDRKLLSQFSRFAEQGESVENQSEAADGKLKAKGKKQRKKANHSKETEKTASDKSKEQSKSSKESSRPEKAASDASQVSHE